jgi:uncharacterized protein (TIGR03435 family)
MTSLLVKVTVALTVSLLCARFARNSRAAVRHAVLAGGFAIVLMLPMASMVSAVVAVSIPIGPQVEAVDRYATGVFGTAARSAAANTSGRMAPEAGERRVPLATAMIAAWVAGGIVLVVPVLAGLWEMRRIRGGARPCPQSEDLARHIASAAGLRRPIAVLLHNGVTGPMTCGVLRPAIILPAEAREWPEGDMTRALVHELEHVRRSDWLTHCLARIVCALYWFHPLVWIAWRKLSLEAERACDDAVVVRADPEQYADQLLSLAERLFAGRRYPQLAMANSRDLSRRVLAVLDDAQQRGRAGGRCLSGIVAGATALMVVLAALTPGRSETFRASAAETPAGTFAAFAAQSAGREEFDVASVRQNTSVGQSITGLEFLPGGRVRATNYPVALVIADAYDVGIREIVWNDKPSMALRLDIDARAGTNVSNRQLRAMLQSLLADRFKLAMHSETREMPVYALVAPNGGRRLKPSPSDRKCPEEPCGRVGGGPTSGLIGRDADMATLAETLSLFLDRHVLDQTGLKGRYDITVSAWASRDASTGRPVSGPSDTSLFTLIEDELGLKLESSRGPRPVYVVDRLEPPTPD